MVVDTGRLAIPPEGVRQGGRVAMTASPETAQTFPAWLPATARTYLRHTAAGMSIRALARESGCHASTVLRQVRKFEQRRDDPLVDEGLDHIGGHAPDRAAERIFTGLGSADRGISGMTAHARRMPQPADEHALAREARRILRRLCEAGTVLAVAADMDKAVVLKGAARVAVLDRGIAQAFALKDWIAVVRTGKVTSYEITRAGRAALRRMLAGDRSDSGSAESFAGAPAPFGEPHRDWAEKAVPGRGSDAPKLVRYNLSESPLTALARRRDKDGEPFLNTAQIAAGERLREDFELAQLGPRIAQNWDRFLTAGGAPAFNPDAAEGGSPAARDRVAMALKELGPGLGDMVLRTCCFLEGLEVAEKRLGWSARSGKIVLRIALTRLIRHYEETYGKGLPLIG